ncbi:DMT family transporter [Solirubrobacter sp. CPCC 204708]|uniref:DMT family transporter n=1 Tax=Solirubrobacter deserti TaxID=2282478 RepID=A0ABT4RLA4_9ACTN|nr:EamA family transporter [Solirubrobacter deserti]MBE2317346.1 DMT family transporter [Solirubrobacter deserti]MDA0139075.1 DMT family transporter [Solirubrobacter deserti]
MSGAPAALLASLLWGTADFLAGRASRVHPAVLVALVGQAAGLVALTIILAIRGVDSGAFLPGALSGVVGSVAILCFYRSLALGTMSVIAPIVATSSIVPVVAGVVFDGERPGALQWVGMALALAGVILASREPAHTTAIDPRRAIQLALIAAVFIGLALICLDAAAEHDALGGVAAARVVGVVVLGALAWRTAARAPLSELPKLGGIGLLDTGANTAFAIATTGGLLSLVSVLGGLFPVVTVALAYLILHERLVPVQRVGVALALAGVPLISV